MILRSTNESRAAVWKTQFKCNLPFTNGLDDISKDLPKTAGKKTCVPQGFHLQFLTGTQTVLTMRSEGRASAGEYQLHLA